MTQTTAEVASSGLNLPEQPPGQCSPRLTADREREILRAAYDLVALLGLMAESVASTDGPLFAGLVMAMRTDPELAAEMRVLQATKQSLAADICTRAIARGEL